ncbi:ABC transporter ATP-binding protein [Pseudoclavibacter endophyticus]|uniref:ABC transporter ATP-binding protein n=1 Tax=Pseudoclavibacter endophyticus TaxID=1778590 RepID=UPI00166C4926|nr:ATP-binding cassette domain-containing protein [Pseudoclavibacter endophyticus]GGA75567.1 ABC transporter ATP-binding protein [Pseudoclavibacter endophyticus]
MSAETPDASATTRGNDRMLAAGDHAARPALSVRGLEIDFNGRTIVRGVDLDLVPGRVLAIVGPSGAGKSVTARALVGLAGAGARVRADRFEMLERGAEGREARRAIDLRSGRDRDWRRVRGRLAGLVLQDALVALDPLRTVGRELDEAMGRLPGVPKRERRARAAALLERAGLDDPAAYLGRRADELSGGQRQRALIATAIAQHPDIVIADEPTASLDRDTRDGVLELLRELARGGVAVLLVSHDLDAVGRVADEVRELSDGGLREAGAAPVLPPSASAPRGAQAVPAPRPTQPRAAATSPRPVVLGVHGVSKAFTVPGGRRIQAVDDARLNLRAGETVGLVGASGSGKSTLGRLILGLERPDSGTIELDGRSWSPATEAERRPMRGAVGHVPQDALSSFDPRRTVGAILADALSRGASRSPRTHRDGIEAALDEVALSRDLATRRPLHLSGGQRQRVAIARALAAEPRVLVCDEAVSALDPASTDGVLDLLEGLQRERGLALLFISHDPLVTAQISHRTLRMASGRLESAP